MIRFLLPLFTFCAVTLSATPLVQTLEYLQRSMPTEQYEALSPHIEATALLIETASPKEKERLYADFLKTITTHRSSHNIDASLKSFTSRSVTPKSFAARQHRYWHTNIASEQNSHLSIIWKVLGGLTVCSIIYLAITALQNKTAKKTLTIQRRNNHQGWRHSNEGSHIYAVVMGYEA